MTNSPTYDKQITLNDYWEQIGGLVMLPGTNRATDRFVRASFYINAVEQTADPRTAVADLKGLDFSSGAPVKKLSLTGGEIYAGNAAGEFRESEPFPFLFGV